MKRSGTWGPSSPCFRVPSKSRSCPAHTFTLAPRGSLALVGRCFEQYTVVPFFPFTELLGAGWLRLCNYRDDGSAGSAPPRGKETPAPGRAANPRARVHGMKFDEFSLARTAALAAAAVVMLTLLPVNAALADEATYATRNGPQTESALRTEYKTPVIRVRGTWPHGAQRIRSRGHSTTAHRTRIQGTGSNRVRVGDDLGAPRVQLYLSGSERRLLAWSLRRHPTVVSRPAKRRTASYPSRGFVF
jgi:hypothetical protein